MAKSLHLRDLARKGDFRKTSFGFPKNTLFTQAGGGGGGNYLVRMCGANSPLFQRCQVYDKPPFSKKKYITDPVFHLCYMII